MEISTDTRHESNKDPRKNIMKVVKIKKETYKSGINIHVWKRRKYINENIYVISSDIH
jgi:hypothetical protein